ncbi:hypothetical protein QBC36DRAFT_316208 [Triangularia setosa]|uniref:Uncharacterized protein n=1 Tax=Triangularia setosa TaxID=2587417 RepID=A0AAN6VWA9_9PEZI|nr:hypothetical protein QBC36DRAFT_316208 [Podospora setosa]
MDSKRAACANTTFSPFVPSPGWECKRCVLFNKVFRSHDFLNQLWKKNIRSEFIGSKLDDLVAQSATQGSHYIDLAKPRERAASILAYLHTHKYREDTCEAEITSPDGGKITLNIWQWVHQAQHAEVDSFERSFPADKIDSVRYAFVIGARHRVEDQAMHVIEKRRFKPLAGQGFEFYQFGDVIIYPKPWGMFSILLGLILDSQNDTTAKAHKNKRNGNVPADPFSLSPTKARENIVLASECEIPRNKPHKEIRVATDALPPVTKTTLAAESSGQTLNKGKTEAGITSEPHEISLGKRKRQKVPDSLDQPVPKKVKEEASVASEDYEVHRKKTPARRKAFPKHDGENGAAKKDSKGEGSQARKPLPKHDGANGASKGDSKEEGSQAPKPLLGPDTVFCLSPDMIQFHGQQQDNTEASTKSQPRSKRNLNT